MADDTFNLGAVAANVGVQAAINPALFPVLPQEDDARLEALCDEQGFLPSSKDIGNAISYGYNTVTNIQESVMSQVFAEFHEIVNEIHTLYMEVQGAVNEELAHVQQTIEALVYGIATVTGSELAIVQEELSTLQTEVLRLQSGSASVTTASGAGGAGYGGSSTATATGGTANAGTSAPDMVVGVEVEGQPVNYPGYPQPPGTTPTPIPLTPPLSPPGPVPPPFPPFPTTQPPFPRPAPLPGRFPGPIPAPPYTPGGMLFPDTAEDDCTQLPHILGAGAGWPESEIPKSDEATPTFPSTHPQMMDYTPVEVAAAGYYRGTMAPLVNVFRDPPGAPCDWRERSAWDYAAWLNGQILGV